MTAVDHVTAPARDISFIANTGMGGVEALAAMGLTRIEQ